VISRRSQTGWSTHGHSAADVNIYTSDANVARSLMGSHENTEVGEFLSKYLDVDVDAITEELRLKGVSWEEKDASGRVVSSWTGALPGQNERLDAQDHLNHYSGAHKRCELCGH
jgi:alkaline phosphatase